MLLQSLAEYQGYKIKSKSTSKQREADEIFERHGDDSEGSDFTAAIIVFILSTLCFILTCLVIIVGNIFYQEINFTLPYVSRLEEFEIFCDDLSLSPDEDVETFGPWTNNLLNVSVNGDGKYVCKSKNLGDLANKVIERTLRHRQAEGKEQMPYLSCGNKSFASKSGYHTVTLTKVSKHSKLHGDDRKDTVLHWENKNGTRNSSGDVMLPKYDKAEITVETGQTYVVYASVHVNISRHSGDDRVQKGNRQIFTLKVCKRLYGYEEILLGESKQFSRDLDTDVISTVRVAGHLLLRKNDVIYTKVSHVNNVIRTSTGNTFGMFPL